MRTKQQFGKKKQNGLVLLVLIVVIALSFISYVISNLSIFEVQVNQINKTQLALKKAKRALIDFALIDSDIDAARSGKFGFLPCPDYLNNGNEGVQEGNCDPMDTSLIGLLPNRTIGLPRLRDGTGSCLLYAVSGSYKQSPETNMLNADTNGQFEIVDEGGNPIQGVLPEDRIVAVVFAPGKVLAGQARTFTVGSDCGRDYGNVSAYLEGNGIVDNAVLNGVADSIDQFIRRTSTSDEGVNPYNDNFITVTREELWQAIVARNDFDQKMENLTHALALCLAEYANQADNDSRRLPWPVKKDLNGADYRDEDNYQDDEDVDLIGHGYSGRFPFNITSSNDAINSVDMTDDELINAVGLCDNLDVGGGIIADLETPGSEYRELWNNWKDHYFYTLSKEYAPADSGESDCGLGNCISVNGLANTYAATVIFSGTRLGLQTRNNKSDVSEYLEDGKSVQFTNESFSRNGMQEYLYTDPQTATENDIMYCVEDVVITNAGNKVNPTVDLLTVVECS